MLLELAHNATTIIVELENFEMGFMDWKSSKDTRDDAKFLKITASTIARCWSTKT